MSFKIVKFFDGKTPIRVVPENWENGAMCHVPEYSDESCTVLQRGPRTPCTVLRNGIESNDEAKMILDSIESELAEKRAQMMVSNFKSICYVNHFGSDNL